MDYLLLTYVIYHQGLVTPHIAAGINLNFWPAGVIFRRAGAFFLRRSFAGNKLYMAVFREYLQLLFKKGYPVKYYAEGGRSRTGRLLPPKTGMLSMTLQAIIKGNSRPVSLVPVYIGYEHVMEVATYQKELRGSKKKKESTRGIFSAIRKLKNYGFGYLNFGEPIQLHNFLDAQVPDWRETKEEDPSKKPVWLTPTVNALASRIMNRINQAAAVNGVALSALCLLSAKKHVMTKEELIQTVEHYQQLLKQAPYSKLATFPEKKASEVIEHTLSLNKIDVRQDSFGEVVSLSPQNAILLTYYRNTILHLFAVPGLLAAILFAKSRISRDELVDVLSQLYPLVQRELFIHMDSEQVKVHANMQIDAMLGIGMIHLHGEDSGSLVLPEARENTFYSLWLLNRCIQETTQRYALVLTLVTGCKGVSRSSLEKQSAQLAERFSALYGISSPEFFDKNVLSTFIVSLRENGYLEVDEQGLFSANQNTQGLYDVVVSLIAPDMAQHVQRLIPQLDTDKSTA
jgi:glycerol-3-phosphate O-acyltransferase